MGILDSFKRSFQNHFDKQKEEREMMEKIQQEARAHKLQIMEEEFRKNSLLVAEAHAKKEAATKSGLQKLRATNRARNLANPQMASPGSLFEKLGEYTQKNLAKREDNLKKTAEMRKVAEEMKIERAVKMKKEREERMTRSNSRVPLKNSLRSQSTWKM